jgi:hypothetical protein
MLDAVALHDRTVMGVSMVKSWKAFCFFATVSSPSSLEKHKVICTRISDVIHIARLPRKRGQLSSFRGSLPGSSGSHQVYLLWCLYKVVATAVFLSIQDIWAIAPPIQFHAFPGLPRADSGFAYLTVVLCPGLKRSEFCCQNRCFYVHFRPAFRIEALFFDPTVIGEIPVPISSTVCSETRRP